MRKGLDTASLSVLHELAHALNHWRFPPTLEHHKLSETVRASLEPFYENQREAELGYALEVCLWGGYVLQIPRVQGQKVIFEYITKENKLTLSVCPKHT